MILLHQIQRNLAKSSLSEICEELARGVCVAMEAQSPLDCHNKVVNIVYGLAAGQLVSIDIVEYSFLVELEEDVVADQVIVEDAVSDGMAGGEFQAILAFFSDFRDDDAWSIDEVHRWIVDYLEAADGFCKTWFCPSSGATLA